MNGAKPDQNNPFCYFSPYGYHLSFINAVCLRLFWPFCNCVHTELSFLICEVQCDQSIPVTLTKKFIYFNLLPFPKGEIGNMVVFSTMIFRHFLLWVLSASQLVVFPSSWYPSLPTSSHEYTYSSLWEKEELLALNK